VRALKRASLLAPVLLAGASLACGPTPFVSDAGSDPVDAAESADAADDAPLPACGATAVDVVRGRVLDASGAPVERARPQLCARLEPDGRLVCLTPPFSGADGTFTIEVPPEVRCMRSAAMRVLVTGGPYATTYCPIDLAPTSAGTLEIARAVELFEVLREPLPPVGDPATPREVQLGGALVLEVSPADVGGEADYARLGAADVEPSRSCVPEARALEGLVAATPEVELDAPFRLLGSGLAEGTRVDLFLIGGLGTRLADGTEVEEAQLVRFGGGSVEADGSITPEAGLRLPHLGWLGWATAR